MTHTPTLTTERGGAHTTCRCSCGWESERHPSGAGAAVAFAGHLAGVRGA